LIHGKALHRILSSLLAPADPRVPDEAGVLLAASLELLLGEQAWMLALLRVGSGPHSPHLAALAAALDAYEGAVRTNLSLYVSCLQLYLCHVHMHMHE
jgi:hypothetical protein